MPKFEPNKPLTTREPTVAVDAGLPVGRHRFELVVEDEEGNRSEPVVTTVTIVERRVQPDTRPGGPGGSM